MRESPKHKIMKMAAGWKTMTADINMADSPPPEIMSCASKWTKMMADDVLGITFKAIVDEVPQAVVGDDDDDDDDSIGSVRGDDYDRSRFGYWKIFKWAFSDHFFKADSLANLDSAISNFEMLRNYLYTSKKETCDLLLEAWKPQKQCIKPKTSDLKGHRPASSGRPRPTGTGTESCLPDVAALPLASLSLEAEPDLPEENNKPTKNTAIGHLGLNANENFILIKELGKVQRKEKNVLEARAQDNCEKKKYERLGKISKYLNSLYRLVGLASEGNPPSERSFESLFIEYADIFEVVFRYGDVPGRSMMVYGQRVISIPDFRFDKEFDEQWMIVTCGEVKKEAKVMSFQVSDRQLRCHDGHGDQKKEKTPESYDDVSLSDALLGQHAVELLLELPFSAMKVCGKKNRNCVLGLIVQATKVRLTCLAMKQESIDHLQQCSLNDFSYSKSKKRKGTFYYTQAYDMLNTDDFKHILCILLSLRHVASMDYP